MKYIIFIGSGTMGNGIAHNFAQYGFKVSLVDNKEKALQAGLATINKNLDRQVNKGSIDELAKQETLDNIRTFSKLEEGISHPDLIIEAVSEDLDMKLSLFEKLSTHCPPQTIFATNTSAISIT